jgi:hypothetical protein
MPIDRQSEGLFLTKTFLTPDMLNDKQIGPVRRVVDAFAGRGDVAAAIEGARE